VIITSENQAGIVEICMDNPPVNALPARQWLELAEAVEGAGRKDATRIVIVRAEGKGFNAGVDIKELHGCEDHSALIAVNRGCYAAFKAIYECPVPVIAAVQGYCLGGGIGLVGNADIIIASEDATFGLPEVKQGALGAATHLARLVPQHRVRAMVYTTDTATAEELHRYGSVLQVTSRQELLPAARKLAARIAAFHPTVIRAAKHCLNGIDPVDVNKSYRFEQGFTFELNLTEVSDASRAAFVEKRSPNRAG
jgi:enoyl-CoA hydratase